ncbi:MAG: hypothetical protein HFI17_04265 [Lachnospiraceae bacterium]|nr:hypothetical protein [Lachnospiraceae bacterium]
MDKYEYRLKAEQIEKLVKKKDYAGAAKIADTIDWRRVKNVNMLYIVSEIYEATERYGECMEILDIAYDRAPVGRMLLYRMTEVCTKMNNFDEAIALYREFVKVAPHDQSRYILKYQIYRERGSSLEDQIKILNEYKTHEYQEKWAYELAALYDEAGMQEECVRECDELILWFSEGEYVAKALKLKQKYEPLTEAQKEKYHSEVKGAPASIGGDDFEEPEVTEFDPGRFNTMNLQAELAGNLDELLQEDATIDLPDLGFGEAPSEEAEEPDFREDGTIDLPDLGFGEAPPEEAEEPDFREDGTIDLPVLGFGEEPPEKAEEPDFREDGTIELPDLGFGEEPPEKAEEPDFREDGTIELPDLGFGEEPPEKAEEPDFREDGTIELPDLGFGEEPPEKAEEPDFREDGTIELPDLGFGEEPPEKAEEPDFREGGTIDLPDLGFGEEPPEKAEEPDFREDGTIELPDLGFGEAPQEEVEEEPEPDFREAGTIELPDLGFGEKPPEKAEESEPNVWKDGMIELPDSGFGSGTAKETEEELSFPEETSESGHEGTEQLSVNEILDEWEQKKAKTEALLEAGAREEQKRREKVKQETAELIKLIEGVSDMIPEDVQRILQEADEERKARETASVITEDDLPQDLDDEIEEEEEEEEEELAIEFVEEPSSGSEKKRLSGDTTSLNMIQELERSLAAEVSEMAINSGHLTEEQARLFAYFTSVKGMSQQLSVLFKGDSREGMTNSSRGNLIVTGKQGNGKTTLAIDIVKALQKQQQIGGNKLAKISGQKLNTKDVYEVLTRLKGGALIIEGAGGLSDATMMALSLVMEADTGGLLVILEDTAEEIERLFHKNKNFASKFEHSIDIPVFTNDELVAFGTSYALEQEYSFDEFGKLALYDRIGSRQTNDHLVTVAEVKEIIDRAIEHAEKAGVRRILDRITRKSVDEFGNRLLREADFME